MKTLWRNLTPSTTRDMAKAHNEVYHDSVPTAQVEVDEHEPGPPRVPKYKVVCPVCEGKGE